MKHLTVTLILFTFLCIALNAQETKTRKEKKREKNELEFAKIDSLIEGKQYKFDARKANPSGGSQVDLTTFDAELTINNDSVISYLPFFGRAYNVAYGGSDSGIKFETILENYIVEKNTEKLTLNISFKAKDERDSYDCNFSVNSNGSAILSVTSNNRAFISYSGEIITLNKE